MREYTLTLNPNRATAYQRPVLEQNGQQAVFILNPPPRPSQALFPTHLINPQSPRGYLQHSVSLPPLPLLKYNAVAVSLSSNTLSVCILVSPTHPTIHLTYHYKPPLKAPTPSTRLLSAHGPCKLWHIERLVAPLTLDVAISVIRDPSPSADAVVARRALVERWTRTVRVSCPHDNLTRMLGLANVRLCEAVFAAPKLGRVHSPGGGMFYCGVWCNDQAEYAAPALALFGEEERAVVLNCLRVLGANFDWERGLVPYSVEVDGGYIGRVDRGDAAMFAWGAALFMLVVGREEMSREVFGYVKFVCDLLMGKMAEGGVIRSESDELEGRFATGDANLSVNCLAILGLLSGAEVAREVGEWRLGEVYEEAAEALREAAHKYFGVDDARRYAYYEGCKDARGWACLTALAGLEDGLDALRYVLSELWVGGDQAVEKNGGGVLVSEESSDIWDRCTLYAIRVAFRAGLVEEGSEKLSEYATKRDSSGDALPFAVENNGSYAQLSAESGLLIRVFTEGLLGMEFKHGRTMTLRPRCPTNWEKYSVCDVYYLNVCLEFKIEKTGMGIRLEVDSSISSAAAEFSNGRLVLLRVSKQNALTLTSEELYAL